jgi:N-acetylmuramoyl-L-alanine amidase
MSGNPSMLRILIFSLALAVAAPAWAAGKPIVTDVRVGVQDGTTQFVLDVSAPIQVQRVFTLPAPYRVVIDLPSSKEQPDLRNEQVNTGIVSAYRSGRFNVRTFRLVLEVNGPARVLRHYPLPGNRYVFQLKPVSAATFAREQQAPPVLTAAVSGPPIPRAKPERSANKTLIVIDPGHGGIDPGATRGKKILEKDITLAVAKRIKKELEKSSRYSVLLTRDGDIFMSLHDRFMVAQGRLADLFISIHADSIRKRGIRGAAVYRLSDQASDEEAEALAQKENQADVLAGVESFDSYGDSTRDLLVKLQQGKAQERAIHFSGMLVAALRGEQVKMLRKPRRHAGFVVLKAPEVASVLVELGYLSNKRDSGLLRSPKHQARLARAVRRAVDRYFTDEISMK